MIEVDTSMPKYIPSGDKIPGLTTPSPVADVHFTAYSAGKYEVHVNENGSWYSVFVGGER